MSIMHNEDHMSMKRITGTQEESHKHKEDHMSIQRIT